MIGAFKPYPAYKGPGVRWLGEVPAHWKVLRQRNAVDMRVSNVDKHIKDGEQPVRLCNYVDVYKSDRITDQIVFMRASATREEIERFQLRTDDVLITKDSETWNDIGVPALIQYTAPDLICGYHLALLRPREAVMLGPFLLRAQQSLPVAHQYHVLANGVTRYGLSHDAIKSIFLPCPPLPEQSAIARFLDHADRRIQRYVQAKRKLIALLNEQKQAIIHQAVTRGLDPKVRLKESGSSWFPETPEHWGVLPMRRVIRRAVDGPHHSPEYLDEGVPFLSARNIKVDRWSLANAKFISEADYQEFCKRVTPEPGDVLYTKGGTTGVARAVDLDFRFQIWVHVAVLKLNKIKVAPEYLAAALNTPRCYEQAQLFTRGATNQDLGLGRMKDIVLPVPPLAEQEAIVAYVKGATRDLERAIAGARKEIELLHEYRIRLIADVTTGKLDVREAAARLPDRTDEEPVIGQGVDEGEADDSADLSEEDVLEDA